MLVEDQTKDQLLAELAQLRQRVAELEAKEAKRNQTEEELRLNEDRWRSYVELAPYGVFVANEKGEYLYVNQKACRITGYTEAELLRLTVPDLIAPEFLTAGEEHFRKVTKDGHAPETEFMFIHKNGQTRWWSVAAVKFSDTRFMGFVNDITERKRVEMTLENRVTALTQPLDAEADTIVFEDLFNLDDIQRLQDEFATAAGVASIITHTDGTPITRPSNFCRLCNDIIRVTETGRLNCYKSDAALGRHHPSGPVVQPCMSGGLWDAGAGISVNGRHVANWLIGQVRDQTQTEEKMREYARTIGADEQAFMEAFRAVPAMSREQFEQIARALFTLANQLSATAYQNVQQARLISHRKRTEEALSQSEEQYRLLAENSSDMISRHSPEGLYQYASPACRKLLGYEPEELLGHSAFEFVHPDDQGKVAHSLELVLGSLAVDMPTYRLRKKDGDYVWVESVSRSIRNEETGAVKEIQVSTRNITQRKQIEEALVLEKTFNDAIFNSVPGMIYLYDAAGQLVKWNKKHEMMTGYSAEELGRMQLLDWYKGDEKSIAAVTTGVKTTLETGFGEAEADLQRKDGTTIPMYFTASPLIINGEQYFTGIGIDLTGRKQAEDALRATEERYSLINNSSRDSIYSYDTTGRFTSANRSLCETLNLEAHQIIGRTHAELGFPAELCAAWDQLHRQVYETDKTVISETYAPTPDGSVHFYEVILNPLHDSNGTIIGIGGSTRDITERKQAEAAKQASEKKWSTLFEAMTEMVVLHELVFNDQGEAIDYRIIDCNTAYTTTTGITKENARGKLAAEVYQSTPPPYLTEFSQVALTGEPYEYATYYAPMDRHFVISVVSPQHGQFATITTDITAIKQIEETVSAKNKELENYLYVASHDLRSPLVNIQGFSQRLQKQTGAITAILSQHTFAPEVQLQLEGIIQNGIPKSLDFIFNNVAKMDTLINGLLQISRTGRMAMTIKEINLNHLLANVIRTFSFQIEEAAAQIIIKELPVCYGDENLLHQLFSNIFGNALKYRDPNQPLIITITGQKQYNKVIYTVHDTGVGMEARHLEKIWDVFYRVNAQAPTAGEGIGLSIVKRIVDKHKGRVWAESQPGQGSTFYIELRAQKFSE